jgi:Ca-activated chloride channel family protein
MMMYLRYITWPWALVLAVVLPVAITWLVIHARRVRAKRLAHLGTPAMIARLAPETVSGLEVASTALGLAALFASIALAGPRWGVERTVVNQAGIDVVLALDASTSMLAQDEQPDRLAKMKQVVDRLRELSPNDRFALVAFAGSAYVLSPMTVDAAALNLFLDNLDPTVVGQSGSSIAAAVTMSSRLIASAKSEAEKAIIVMSDGEAFEDEAAVRDAAKKAADGGATVITVGFGTLAGATIPVRQNGVVAPKRDQDGQVVLTRYSPICCAAAADAGRGVFVEPTNADRAAAVRRQLATLRTQQRSITSGSNLGLQYQVFLIPSLLLLLLDTFLGARQARRRKLAAPAMTAAASVAILVAGCQLPPKRDRAAIDLYNRGTALIHRPDSILAAVPLLHRAAESADTAVKYRAASMRDLCILQLGWPRLEIQPICRSIARSPSTSAC